MTKAVEIIQRRKSSLFNKWFWENWTVQCKSMKLEHSLTTYTNITSKWFKDLNLRPQNRKLLKENIGKTLFDITCSNNFLHMCHKAKEVKTKINRWFLIKFKSFCSGKETINKTKTLKNRSKIFLNDVTDKLLINIQNIQSVYIMTSTEQTMQSEKWAEDLIRYFSKEDIQMANRHTKRCSVSREIKIKPTMRNQFTPDRMALIKKSKTTNLKRYTNTPVFIAALFMTAKT